MSECYYNSANSSSSYFDSILIFSLIKSTDIYRLVLAMLAIYAKSPLASIIGWYK
jgi:hypothetical protein